MNIHTKLENTLQTLQALGNAVYDLVTSSSDIFDDSAIQSRLEDFLKAHKEATQRLLNPRLIMAAIGTTSSGKSTVVNALMGRSIAPIEAGEMSGGVLTLRHSEESRLIIEATPEAVWETGEWTGLSDDEIYSKIQSVMHLYHQERRKKEFIAPQIKVDASLFPACDFTFSGLPEGIGLEFLDLPGLKSVQDRDNLAVIQPLVGKAFSIVTLDYTQVDEEHRQRLLAELKKVVEYLQGRTDSMIFVLNRVDRRTQKDKCIEERIAELKVEIKDILGLKEEPNVLPFNALLLFYAQCAWGNSPLGEPSTINPEIRLKHLQDLFNDCLNILFQYSANDPNITAWLLDVRTKVINNEPIDDYKMRRILYLAMKWSGGEGLWNCMRKRIQQSFTELVILPALLDVFNSYDSLSSSLHLLIQTSKITNLEDVKQKQAELLKFRQEFPDLAKKVNDDFDQELEGYIKAFKSKDQTQISQIIQKAEKEGRKGFQAIFATVDEVEADLITDIIAPVRDAFINKQGAYDLEDQLQKVIAPPLAKNVAREYDNLSRRIGDFTPQNGYLVKKVRMDDSKKIKELEHDERYVRLLFHTMKDALTARAEFTLQAKENDFIKALDALVQDQMTRLIFCIHEDILQSLDIEQAVISDLQKKLNENLTKLPEKFFNFDADIKEDTSNQKEKTGTKAETRSREVGSCFDKHTESYTEYVDEYENIKYKQLLIPDIETMARQWANGIDNSKYGKGGLWDILFDWITDKLNYVSYLFKESVNNILNLIERILNEQSERLQQQQLELEKLAKFESCHDTANNIRQELAKVFNLRDEEVITDEFI